LLFIFLRSPNVQLANEIAMTYCNYRKYFIRYYRNGACNTILIIIITTGNPSYLDRTPPTYPTPYVPILGLLTHSVEVPLYLYTANFWWFHRKAPQNFVFFSHVAGWNRSDKTAVLKKANKLIRTTN